ncbi:MAG TPA: TIGR03620 family F420-dependent LLM class oxidoreductase [Solirubrobacteraceae bacterium]|nr:TIGR03620 family F420-dependent LLM class oxidoreductase [Solirubrobacteraceae bacterium]
MNLTKYGIWTTYRSLGRENAAGAARLVEQLGFGTFWLGGSAEPEQLRPLLEATGGLVAATGITNIWASEPGPVAEQAAALAAGFPGRALIGIGAGHREHTAEYGRPLTAMRAFLDGLDAAPAPLPESGRVLAALGPKMLELSAARATGAHPYFTPVEHTRFARGHLGSGPLLAPELACAIDDDRDRARAAARAYASSYLALRNYTGNLLRFGFTEADLRDGGSDRLIDAVVPSGSADHVAELVQAHLEAGADHVCLQPVGVAGVPRAQWTALAAALGTS